VPTAVLVSPPSGRPNQLLAAEGDMRGPLGDIAQAAATTSLASPGLGGRGASPLAKRRPSAGNSYPSSTPFPVAAWAAASGDRYPHPLAVDSEGDAEPL